MTPQELDFVARLVRRECGLVLSADKAYLVESRLAPVARRWGAASVDGFIRALMSGASDEQVRDVVEAMVTNETFFFRDRKPFDQFRDHVLPHLLRTRAARRSFRIWCAACSSGQEPYSLAMLLRDAEKELAGWRIDVVATDISREVLRQAREGCYTQFEVQRGLPIQYLMKYFAQSGDRWQVKPEIRSMVEFRQFNLLDSPQGLGQFDVVFCRNVLIYFDQETRQGILDRIASVMAPDGVLYLGGAETVLGVTTRFQPSAEQRGLYGLAGPPAARAVA